MNIYEYQFSNTEVSMARCAVVRNTGGKVKVSWDSEKYVEFRPTNGGAMYTVDCVHLGCGDWMSVFLTTKFKNIKAKYQRAIVSAALALGCTTITLNKDFINLIPLTGSLVLTMKPIKQEALTDQPYSISQHRREEPHHEFQFRNSVVLEIPKVEVKREEKAKVHVEVPTLKVSGKGAWVAVGIAAAVMLGCAVVAASARD